MQRQLIDLSIMSIIKFFMVMVSLLFLYFVRDIIAILFVAIIFTAALSPWVNYLENKKIPRSLSAIFLFIVFFGFIGLIITLVVPAIAGQISDFASNLPKYSEKINRFYSGFYEFTVEDEVANFDKTISLVKDTLTSSAGSVFDTVFQVFGGLIEFFGMLVIMFYMLVEKNAVRRTSDFLIPEKYRSFFIDLINKIQVKISSWFKGQFFLSVLVGLLVYIGLLILGVKYALILALVAFIGEFIPYLGPILSAIPAIFVAFVESPISALFVLILFIVIQQAENHILVPKIMQKAVGLNPLISIIALLIGAKLAGLAGLVLAIPVATAISVIIKEISTLRDKENETKSVAEDEGVEPVEL